MEQTLATLLTFVAFAAVFLRLRIGIIVGLLVAGIAIGPFGAGLISDVGTVAALAELGVIFLLFNVGLEIRLGRLRVFEPRVYVLAVIQIAATTAAIAGLAHMLGLAWDVAVVAGSALALSSTALVFQVLADLGRSVTQLGRVAIATLLVQDLAVGPLLVGVNLIGNGGSGGGAAFVTLALGGGVALAAVVVVSRFLLPPVLRAVAALRAPELFTGLVLLVVLAASWTTGHAGLSSALGAFVAGLMVADTEFRHQIVADIAPFRGLLVGLFFMTVGMKIDLGVAAEDLLTVIALTVGLIAIKGVVLGAAALALGYGPRLALELGVLLAQGSEFSFVVFGAAAAVGILAPEEANLLIVAVALSMAVTALAASFGRQLLDRLEGPAKSPLSDLDAGTAAQRGHVLIIGFGQIGMALTRHLIQLGLRPLVLDFSAQRVRTAQARNFPVFYGNAARSDVLHAAHVAQAELVVVAVPDAEVSMRIVSLIRRLAPSMRILARAPTAEDVAAISAAGANAVVIDGLSTAIDLAERVVLLHSGATEE